LLPASCVRTFVAHCGSLRSVRVSGRPHEPCRCSKRRRSWACVSSGTPGSGILSKNTLLLARAIFGCLAVGWRIGQPVGRCGRSGGGLVDRWICRLAVGSVCRSVGLCVVGRRLPIWARPHIHPSNPLRIPPHGRHSRTHMHTRGPGPPHRYLRKQTHNTRIHKNKTQTHKHREQNSHTHEQHTFKHTHTQAREVCCPRPATCVVWSTHPNGCAHSCRFFCYLQCWLCRARFAHIFDVFAFQFESIHCPMMGGSKETRPARRPPVNDRIQRQGQHEQEGSPAFIRPRMSKLSCCCTMARNKPDHGWVTLSEATVWEGGHTIQPEARPSWLAPRTHTHTHTHFHTPAHPPTHQHKHTHTRTIIHAHTHTCTHACVAKAHTYTHTHTHARTHAHLTTRAHLTTHTQANTSETSETRCPRPNLLYHSGVAIVLSAALDAPLPCCHHTG
jgi:hypothetical protein